MLYSTDYRRYLHGIRKISNEEGSVDIPSFCRRSTHGGGWEERICSDGSLMNFYEMQY